MIFISTAYAQTSQQGTAEFLNTLLMFGLIFLVFYFLVIRPQQKKLKRHRELLHSIKRGDKIVTGGGIIGIIVKIINDNEVLVEISDNVRVKIVRDTITNVINKAEPGGSKNRVDGKGETEDSAPQDGRGHNRVSGRESGEGHVHSLRKLLGQGNLIHRAFS